MARKDLNLRDRVDLTWPLEAKMADTASHNNGAYKNLEADHN